MGVFKKGIFAVFIGVLLAGSASVNFTYANGDSSKEALNPHSLISVLKEFFGENNIYISEEKTKDDVNIKKLWESLGVKREDVSWKEEGDPKERVLFNAFEDGTASLYYRTYQSHIATKTQDEYVILEISQFNSEYQLLLFRKQGDDDWVYVTNEVIRDNGGYQLDLKFYDTDDDSLLFSVVETGGRGTEVFSNYWAFYKLIDGKMRRALLALRSGYHEGWGMLFKREYESEAWPYFYSKPDIGFTYYIKYSGDSVYYNSRFKGAPRFLEAFTLRKNVVFQWDDRTKQYLIDAKRSQLSAGQIQAIFDDGEKEFYAKYKWRIKFLQFFGSERQKEWARVFERVVTGKSETVWVESAGEYIEVAKDIKSPKVAALSIQDSIDALRYYNLKIDETEVGMSYFFGWQPDDKKAMKMAAEEAIAKLDDISKSLENLNLPKELIRARDYHFLVIKGLKKIYEGSEKKSSDQIAKEFDELGKTASEKHAKDVGPVFEELLKSERLAQDYDVLSEEIRYAETNEDKENYRSAVKLIDEKKYKEAYDKLSALREKYKGKVFENCVMLRISDCLLLDDSDLGTVMDGEKVLSEVVSSKTYHPVIFESFEKWRSVYQSNNHGMSNYSVIPNDEYNKKRWDAVKVIKDYLKKNPADRWAREQVNALLESPNISRGITFGNWNLMYYAWFYSPDVFPKDRKNGYRLNQLRFSGDDQKDKESADTTSATKK